MKHATTWQIGNRKFGARAKVYWAKVFSGQSISGPKQVLSQSGLGVKLDESPTDAQWCLFSLKSQTFGLGQTIWADKFLGIWVLFWPIISTYFGTVSSLSMLSINQPLFLQKTKRLYPNPKCLLGKSQIMTLLYTFLVFNTKK